ncbi:MAG: 3-hydroxyacyl-CoA dehydrogenase NAD-binding domain-containing protein [Syntrophomonadaceae bacterium]|nr:3-hydroxyacyl-CoA dehydrogenase NAD-binding domain-containing protein [Syntrophomonadaceae bacterium]
MAINKIGMLGAGTMGQGIAWAFAAAGKKVVLYDIKYEFVERAIHSIGNKLAKAEEKGKAAPGTRDAVVGNLIGTEKFEDLQDVDFIVEGVFENMDVKKDVYTKLDALLAPEVIIATNTSSLSITEIAAICKRADKVVGMHFFNPANVMKLVEVIPALQTSEATVQTVLDLSREIGKKPVTVKEGPGFVVNRILVPTINEACAILYEGLATAEDIDTAMKFGAGWPMGPLALSDMIGGDICLAVMNTLYNETGDPKYRPSGLLKQYVRAGWLGMKTKKGFYNY